MVTGARRHGDVPACSNPTPQRQDRSGGRPAFVGRDHTMATVVDAMRQPCVVFIEGEAGIGKTRLVRESLAAATDRRILVAACAPWRDPFPLGPVVVGLRRLWQRVGAVELSPLGGALRPLFPEWADHLPPAPEPLDDPKEVRHRLLCALTELIERLRVDVLVVDDAHWADSATLEWLLMLAAADWASDAPSIVVTYRPTDIPEDSLLPRLTARSPAALRPVRVALEPLDVAQTRQLVGSMLHTTEVSTEFATFLHEHCDGLPLAVEETVRLLRDRHDIVRQHGTWTRRVLEDLEVPPAVRDSVLERVARLGGDAQLILQAAAILGDPADEALLAAVADVDESSDERGVAAALVSGLLREATPGLYGFRHVLDSQAVEDAMPASVRRQLHYRAAVALQGRDHPSAVRLARHFREAGDIDAWSRYAEATADLALDAGDDHTALVILLEVLATAGHPLERRVRLVRKLAEVAFFGAATLGDLARRVADALRDVLDADSLPQGERGELRLQLSRMLWEDGDGLAAFAETEAAIPDLGHRPDLAIRAMTNLALPAIREWPAARHLLWLDRADGLVERSGTAADRQLLDRSRATTLLLLGEEAGWAYAARLPRSAASSQERRRVAGNFLNVVTAALPWGRYDDTQRLLEEAVEYVEAADYQRRQSYGRLVRAYLDWYTGDWQGLRTAALAIAGSDESELQEQLGARQLVGLLDLAAGARGRAERQLRAVASQYAHHQRVEPEDLAVPAALARLCLADGSAEKALHECGPATELIAQKGVWLWASNVAPVHVDALIAGGELGQAAELVDGFAAGLAGRDAPAPAAALATCWAMLAEAKGDRDQAAEQFADAASVWAAVPRPYDELLTLERHGRCLLTIGEQEQALATLAGARRRLHELGARWDADRIARVLRQHGIDTPRTGQRGRRGYGDQLSPRELEVVELVARGMTNKQIGEQLFLAPKTVDRHLRSAKRKLGASTRVGAAMAAAEAGLLMSTAEDLDRQ
jgi:DNA-binding CsgD family transcriptional regulator